MALFNDRQYIVQRHDSEGDYQIKTKSNDVICYVKKNSNAAEILDITRIFPNIPKSQNVSLYKKLFSFYDDSPIEGLIFNLSFLAKDNQTHYQIRKYIGDEDIVLDVINKDRVIGSIVMKTHLGHIYRKDFCWIYDASHKQIAETKSHYIFTVKFTHEIMDVNGKKIGEIKPKWFTFPLKYTVNIYDTAIDPVFFIVLAIVFLELDIKRYLLGDVST